MPEPSLSVVTEVEWAGPLRPLGEVEIKKRVPVRVVSTFLNAQRATRISQLLAQVAQLKALSPNLDSERPNLEEMARLDVDASSGTL